MEKENPIILRKFLKTLRIQNYSVGTIEGYELDLLIFFDFLIKYLHLEIKIRDINVFILAGIRKSDIIAFLTYLGNNRENNFNTRKRKIASIKTFYNWLFSNYKIFNNKQNIAEIFTCIERTRRLPKYLSLQNAKKIQYIFNISNSKYYLRNNTIISLFLSTGLRISELANIKLKNINFNNKTINIIQKGNKERIVYLNNNIVEKLKEYISTRKRIDLEDNLFLNNKNTKLSNRSIENICKNAFKLAGLEEYNYTVHTLRHTFATYIYKQNKDILLVKEMLGHQSVTTTYIYTHLENDELRKAMERHPLNNLK